MIDNFLKYVERSFEEMAYPTGFKSAIIGIVQQSDGTNALLLDMDKIITILEEEDGMTVEEAWEYFDYNIAGARVDSGPAYLIDKVDIINDG